MKMKLKAVILSVFLLLANIPAISANVVEINVSAAASLKDALLDIMSGFKKTMPDSMVLINFGASGTLAKQIVQGAPADLFVSADGKWIDYLLKEGKCVAETQYTLASNTLVFVGKKRMAIDSLVDLKGLQRIAIGSPASVPAGNYAVQALRAAGVYEELEKEKKLVMAQDVRQALLYADRGEVDGAFVYKTDALLAEHAVVILTVDANLHDRITYPMVVTTAGVERPEVKAFTAYLRSPEAQVVLKEYGFETAE
jgi:molybdate transport system substrate-binding protein